MGGSLSAYCRREGDANELCVEDDELCVEKRLVKLMKQRAAAHQTSVKSFDSFVMKFPKIDAAFQQVRDVFKNYADPKTGTIDLEQLKTCFRELQIEFSEEEVRVFYEEGDIDHNRRVNFKEFILVLALVYLLGGRLLSTGISRFGLPALEWSFETIQDAFVFFDKDGDGYVTREEMAHSICETCKSSGATHTPDDDIAVHRFEEMDWDKDGRVTLKQFLFVFTGWVSIEDEDA